MNRYQAAIARSAEAWKKDRKMQFVDYYILEFLRGAVVLSPLLFTVIHEDLAKLLHWEPTKEHRHALAMEVRELIESDPGFHRFRSDAVTYLSTMREADK